MTSSLRDELNCSICLNVFTDPVTLRCGHNFCRVCIDCVLNTQQRLRVYSCPDCREEFMERPAMPKNITLCNIVEGFLSTQPDEETGVFCTYCVDSPVPALKSCLMCEASLCDKHLKVHNKSQEHVLTEPTTSMEDKKCPVHKKILEYYCIQDSVCICVSCSLAGEHEGHKVELLDVASEKMKKKLKSILDNLISDREGTEKRVLSLQDHNKKVHEKACVSIQRLSALLGEFRGKLNTLENKIPIMISTLENKLSLSASSLIEELEIKNDELSKKICLIEEHCSLSDPIAVLKDQHLCISDHADDETTKEMFDDVHKVGDLDLTLVSALLHTVINDFATQAVSSGFNFPQTSEISLDENTAGNGITISEDLKMASWLGMGQNYLQTPERFQSCQVLSLTSFSSGKHYWEVEWSEQGDCCVGVSYVSIDRQGGQCIIGENDKSWGLRIWNNQYSAIHNTKVMMLSNAVSCRKLGLYLDFEAGQLSFYELQVPIRHLHTFTTTFTEPLHALCWVLGSWLRFSERKEKKENK
ncbi:E3 ubiquitin/ISG15 ligase TRIM25-like [Mantella aurantiaca]